MDSVPADLVIDKMAARIGQLEKEKAILQVQLELLLAQAANAVPQSSDAAPT